MLPEFHECKDIVFVGIYTHKKAKKTVEKYETYRCVVCNNRLTRYLIRANTANIEDHNAA